MPLQFWPRSVALRLYLALSVHHLAMHYLSLFLSSRPKMIFLKVTCSTVENPFRWMTRHIVMALPPRKNLSTSAGVLSSVLRRLHLPRSSLVGAQKSRPSKLRTAQLSNLCLTSLIQSPGRNWRSNLVSSVFKRPRLVSKDFTFMLCFL